ncbi:MAG: flagellar biosynthesis anti-sigma factor FlgM [Bdellovibrionales bacterium]|nr:flagellar biosynthesis anti-sigma factor FlgM [Bdellovibrionales bacterium]
MDKKRLSAKLAEQLEAAREKKLKMLKAQVQSGKYTVNNQYVANSLLPQQKQ